MREGGNFLPALYQAEKGGMGMFRIPQLSSPTCGWIRYNTCVLFD